MADNIGYTPGSGAKVASREVTGYSEGTPVHVQVVGLSTLDGPDDGKTATDVTVDNPLPVVANQSDDLIRMFSRLVKLLESNAIVDSAQRQRITLDAIASGLTLAAITTVSTVSSVTGVSNVTAQAGMDREQYINISRQTAVQSIRSRLNFA